MKKIRSFVLCAALLVCALALSAFAADYVYYENDFSDVTTLSDFTQYRGKWEIVDGQLTLTGLGDLQMNDQAFLLFTKDAGVANLTDYTLEVDMMNIQSQAGPLFRCDPAKVSGETNNSFYGYQAFISFTGERGALGRGNLLGDYAGNIKVSDVILFPGMNIHLRVDAVGKSITYVISDLDTGNELWNYTTENDEWAMGSFGFRACVMHDGLTNLAMLGFDNLKITAHGEVGDHLAAGKKLADYKPKVESAAILPEVTPAIEVKVPAVAEVKASELDLSVKDYVFYENDFSNAKTLSDFTQYRGKWEIKNGALYYTTLTEGFKEATNFSFLLYSANHDANLLTDYTVDVDLINSQTAAGVITHANLAEADSDGVNAFYGYLSFISNDGQKGAVGYGNAEGGWGGNLNVGEATVAVGGTYHMRVEHKEGMLTYTLTNAEGDVLYSFSTAASDWPSGSFGFRARAMTDTLSNLGTMAFDNLKVTVHGAQAALLAAGYHPNAKIIGDVPGASTDAAATEPADAAADMTADTTGAATGDASSDAAGTSAPAAESKTPDGTTAPAGQTDASAASSATSAPAPTDAGGVNAGALIGIIAAVLVVIAVIAFIVVKKKKK
mgnify:FL=1